MKYVLHILITLPLLGFTCVLKADDTGESALRKADPAGIEVGTFKAEVRTTHTTSSGLPDNNVLSVAVIESGDVLAGTAKGLARFRVGNWEQLTEYDGPVKLITPHGEGLLGTTTDAVYQIDLSGINRLADLPEGARDAASLNSLVSRKSILLGTTIGLFKLSDDQFVPVDALHKHAVLKDGNKDIRQVAIAADGRVAVALEAGLFVSDGNDEWKAVNARQGHRSWALYDVRGVAFDSRDRLWFASPQGVGCLEDGKWSLYTGSDGLPYNDFTTLAAGEEGVVWFGTKEGAIRFDGTNWNYRMSPAWLPDNLVHHIAVTKDGNAWFATPEGAGTIERRPMTLAQKAKFFEDEIDKYHRRTPYGFVLSAGLANANDKSEWTNHDSDNDGLWTAMYGAGECFAYAATKDPLAKKRAQAAFEALRFLCKVTQGGTPPALPGFPARTVLPTSGPNPNEVRYTPEKDEESKAKDPLWKVIVPRWPTSADGKWYWKCDTSSDELDGHYFLYAIYYDLVAETEEEKARVRELVVDMTDHLIEHDYQLYDHDGTPTRWGRFSPKDLNGDIIQGARGLNSLSVLSYLKVAEHMTGDKKYLDAYNTLVEKHSYATNTLDPKRRNSPGTGNQSDDEMAYMNYFNILNYETDPRLRDMYLWSLRWHWMLEEPERCPLFNFTFAVFDDAREMEALNIPDRKTYLADGVETLQRIPLDRIRWAFRNDHRTDIVKLPKWTYRHREGGHLYNGKVVPIDERSVEHWNHDAWNLAEGGDGKQLADGTAFLLPYYMGLYYGYIIE